MEQTGPAHQDWNTYIVHCKNESTNVNKENKSVKKNSTDFSKENQLNTKIDEGDFRHKKVSNDVVGDFKKWRLSQNLTQKEVAIKLSISSQIINKFESGKLNNDPKLIGKIKRLMK